MNVEPREESGELPGIAPAPRYYKCRRCKRPLRSERSQRLGYGTFCARLVGATLNGSNSMNDSDRLQLDPLPSAPWNADVKVWREHGSNDTGGIVGASIPRTVIWHSPDGFNFGYSGSGPADLALNILNAFVPPAKGKEWTDRDDAPEKCFRGTCSRFAARHHQQFKRAFIAGMAEPGGTIAAADIRRWIDERLIENGSAAS